MIRCKLDPETLKLQACDKYKQSILFRNEACFAMSEYAHEKLIIYGQPSQNLFLVTDWQVLHTVKDPFQENINKQFIMPLPRFHETKFPFLMMSGDSSFSLLNVHTGHMEPFINTATSVKLC